MDVQQLNLIHKYNAGMERVDVLNRTFRNYHPIFHNKKWWWNLFVKALNIVMVASWLLYSAAHEKNKKFDLSGVSLRSCNC